MTITPWRMFRHTLIVVMICGATWGQRAGQKQLTAQGELKRQAALERRQMAKGRRTETDNSGAGGKRASTLDLTSGLPGAVAALGDGDEATAWQLLTDHAENFKTNWSTLDPAFVVWVADQYRKQKRFKDAQGVCDMVLAKERTITPDMAGRMMLIKGDIFKDQENYQAAKLEYQGIERNKNFAGTEIRRMARFGIADLLRMTKDYEAASEIIEQMKDSSDPDTQAEAYFLGAHVAFDREMYDEARKDIEEVKKRVPDHIEALFLEGELNLRQDRLQDPELEIGSKVLTAYIVPGRPITMKMLDRNLAVVRGAAGIPVMVTTSKGKDREFVTLLPSPRERTMFRGTISTTLGDVTTNDLRLQIGGEDVITYNLIESYRRANNLDFPDKQMLVVADGELLASSGDFISGDKRDQAFIDGQVAALDNEAMLKQKAFERTRDEKIVRPGNPIRIQVTDLDRDVSANTDHVFVDLESSTGDKVVGVELIEATNHSGIFRGKCPTAVAPPKASASGTSKGSPAAVVYAGDTNGWTSSADKKTQKWLEIDLMVVQPLAEATLDVSDSKSFKAVTLFGGEDGQALRQIATTRPTREEMYGYVDLQKHYTGKSKVEGQATGYGYAEVTSDIERDAVFRLGSCNGITCWVNGDQVHSATAERPWKPEEDTIYVRLKAGINSILVKFNPGSGAWGGSLTITDTKGVPLSTMRATPPARHGVVTDWHIVDRPIPDNLRFPAKISVATPFRVADKLAHWIPASTLALASMTATNTQITTLFNQTGAFRRLRWEFEEYSFVTSISVLKAKVVNKFGETLVPAENEFSMISSNRVLEMSGGDKVVVKYSDEHTTRGATAVLSANMNSGFYNGNISLNYETIMDHGEGKRTILYDEALRFRAGSTESLVIRVEDDDLDTSDDTDKVKTLVETVGGQKIWFETKETTPHSGIFIGILRLGTVTSNDTIKIVKGDTIRASYADKDNSDGKVDRMASVADVPDTPPELILYRGVAQTVVTENGSITGMTFSLEVPAEDGVSNPVTSSLDAPLTFKILYPPAALSGGSKLPVKLVTERELAAAAAEKRNPKYTEVQMNLISGADGEFGAEVGLKTDANAESDTSAVSLGEHRRRRGRVAGDAGQDEMLQRAAALQVKGGDVVRIRVSPITAGPTIEGAFRLVSDARLDFTDRKYGTLCNRIFASEWLYLRLSDRDLDVSDELDSTNIVLATKAGKYPLELRETLPHSGIFTGRVKTERAPSSAAPTNGVIGVEYGGSILASYLDATSVHTSTPRTVTASMSIFKGFNGTLATFTKYFADRDIAVKTRLLTAEALFELAKEHRKGDQKDLAEKEIAEGKLALEEALTDFPETKYKAHAEFLLANLAQELDNYQEALERYNKVISHWPDSDYAPRAQLKKAICLEKLNDAENALDAYVELTYAYPSSPLVPDAVIRLGQYFYKNKDYDTAGKIFGSFHAKHPEHELAAKALFLSGQSYLKGAEELVAKSKDPAKTDPKLAGAINASYAEAIVKFDKLVSSYDDKDMRAEGMYWLADCYFKTADMVNSYRTFKRLTWDYPESKWAKFARGQLVQNERVFESVAKEE